MKGIGAIPKNNTTIEERPHIGGITYRIHLHGTLIVHIEVRARRAGEFYPKATATLWSGGYRTSTTKRRINQCLDAFAIPARVIQDKGVWFLWMGGNQVEFKEGIKVEHELNYDSEAFVIPPSMRRLYDFIDLNDG